MRNTIRDWRNVSKRDFNKYFPKEDFIGVKKNAFGKKIEKYVINYLHKVERIKCYSTKEYLLQQKYTYTTKKESILIDSVWYAYPDLICVEPETGLRYFLEVKGKRRWGNQSKSIDEYTGFDLEKHSDYIAVGNALGLPVYVVFVHIENETPQRTGMFRTKTHLSEDMINCFIPTSNGAGGAKGVGWQSKHLLPIGDHTWQVKMELNII